LIEVNNVRDCVMNPKAGVGMGRSARTNGTAAGLASRPPSCSPQRNGSRSPWWRSPRSPLSRCYGSRPAARRAV